MTAPAVHQVAVDLYEELGTTQPLDEATGWQFLAFLHGLAIALGRLPDIVRDTDDQVGWGPLMDPATCPDWALPWLAQFAGVSVKTGEDPDLSRARIVAHAQFNRGTPAAMVAAGQIYLTGSRHVGLLEADTSAYHLTVLTLTDETADADLVEAAIRLQKPAGLILDYQVVDGVTWADATTTWTTVPAIDWAAVDDDYTI